jgi:hypothetical protein
LPKLKLGADKPTTGSVPVPLKVTVCVLPATKLLLSVMVRVPVSGPVSVGEKVTLILQERPASTLLPHLLVSPKLALAVILVIVSAALPMLLRVTGFDTLVVPTTCSSKSRADAESFAVGGEPNLLMKASA